MSEREQMISALRSRHAFFMNGATWMEAVDPDELCQDAATEIERLRGALEIFCADMVVPPGTVISVALAVNDEFYRRREIAKAALAEPSTSRLVAV